MWFLPSFLTSFDQQAGERGDKINSVLVKNIIKARNCLGLQQLKYDNLIAIMIHLIFLVALY